MNTDFEKFLSRHGEVVVQAILENVERYNGICANPSAALEARWARVMNDADTKVAA